MHLGQIESQVPESAKRKLTLLDVERTLARTHLHLQLRCCGAECMRLRPLHRYLHLTLCGLPIGAGSGKNGVAQSLAFAWVRIDQALRGELIAEGLPKCHARAHLRSRPGHRCCRELYNW